MRVFMEDKEENLYQESPVETIEGKPIDTPVRIIDPDTLRSGDTSYRLTGFNAPETAKLQGGIFVPNQVANDQSQRIVNRIATEGGFTNLEGVDTDPYGRVVAKQTNDIGQDLGDTLTILGLFNPNLHTSSEVGKEAIAFKASQGLFPEAAQQDSLIKAAMEEKENRIKEEGNPTYMPKVMLNDERQYAAVKNMTGIPAVKNEVEEIARLENILATETLSESTKLNLQKQIESARQRLFFAATTPDLAGGVSVRRGDRTMMNQAHNQFSTAFKYATLDMVNGLGGMLQIAGDEAKWDWLSNKGQELITQTKFEQGDLATTLSSFKDIRTNDPWSAVTDTATYVGNLVAGTLPMMGLIIGSTAATGGLGLTGLAGYSIASIPPSLMYSGQFYAEQPDDKKDTGLAMSMGIASGVLDKLGLDGMATALNPFTAMGRKELSEILVKRGMTTEQASDAILEASKRELVELSGMGADFARKQYASSQAKLLTASALGVRSGVEAGTESLQQAAQMIAESGDWSLDVQYEKDFYDQLLDAAVGGGVMGIGIGGASAAIDIAGWDSAADAMVAYKKGISDAQRFNLEQSEIEGGAKNIREAANKARVSNNSKTLDDLANEVNGGGAWNALKAVVTDPLRLTRKLVDTAIPSITKEDGTFKTNLAYLKAIMGGSGILPGDNYAGLKQRMIGWWSGNHAEDLASALNANVYDTEKLVKRTWNNVWSKGLRLEGSSPQEIALQTWKDQIDKTTVDMKATAQEAGIEAPELYEPDAMFVDSTVHPKVIMANKEQLIEFMVQEGANRRQADVAVDNVISGDPNTAKPAKDFMRQYGVFNTDKFEYLFEPNIFTSMENLKDRIADRVSDTVLLGNKGQVIANLLQAAIDNNEFESNAERINAIKEVSDWYKIIQGDYHPMDNYPVMNTIMSWGNTLTMLAYLGKATLSSIPEAAFATLGTQGKYVQTQIANSVKMFFQEYKSDINNFASWSTSSVGISLARSVAHGRLKTKIDKLEKEHQELLDQGEKADPAKLKSLEKRVISLHKEDLGRDMFERLGYNETGYNTQTKFELGSVNNNMRKTMQVFASAIGLRSITDGLRIATLSVAADIMTSKVSNIRNIPKSERDYAFKTGVGLNNSQAQDLSDLIEYGMDVPSLMNFLDKTENLIGFDINDVFNKNYLMADGSDPIRQNILTTMSNMVDSKITHPQPHNMPKYYHDPRLRLLTVMTRFVGAFTSTILPKLYRKYLIDGNAGMRYQAFSVIASSLLLASFANALKDELAYGEENPYLTTTREKMQRTLYSSGLLGRYEAVADALVPLYPDRKPSFTRDPLGAAYSTARDVSPVVGYADKVAATGRAIAEGETAEAVKKGSRVMPVIASFPIVGSTLSDLVKDLYTN